MSSWLTPTWLLHFACTGLCTNKTARTGKTTWHHATRRSCHWCCKAASQACSAPSSWCQGSCAGSEVKWRGGGVSLFFWHSAGVRWTRRLNCEIQRLAGYSGITWRHGINTQLTLMASPGGWGVKTGRPGSKARSTCLLIYCSCWRENWVRRFSFHGMLGPGSTLIPLLTFSYRQESNNAVKWCHGLRGFLLPPALFCTDYQ